MSDVTVTIADVVPGTVERDRSTIQVGDGVFDTFGGRYTVTAVRRFKRWTRCTRSRDGDTFTLHGEETITVIPGGAP